MVKRDVSGKKGQLLCCKCIFNWIKANLAKIQPKNHQNVQKIHFLQKAPGVNGLMKTLIFFGMIHTLGIKHKLLDQVHNLE